MVKSRFKKPYVIRAIIYICIALVFMFAIWLDFPKGLSETIFGNKNIPKDFGLDESLDIAFIDVGQSESAVIGCQGQYVLIDSGGNDRGYTVLRKLDQLRIREIDTMILTHPHGDHIGGADDIINNIYVEKIYMPDVLNDTMTFEEVLNAANENDVIISAPDAGDELSFDGFKLLFLHPDDGMFEETNNYSIMVKIENDYGSAVFTGDAEMEAESDVLNLGYDIRADLLKVGHHGSATSTSAEFLNAVDPDYAAISCGKNNDYGHPHDEIMDHLKAEKVQSYVTYLKGTIYFSFEPDGVEIKTEK